MEQFAYYHPSMTRLECEKNLSNKKNGCFLIRDSETTTTNHVLSISWDGLVHHFRIKRSKKGLHLECAAGVERYYFDTFDKLISYYQIPNRGLPYNLKDGVVNEMYYEDDIGKDDDEDSDDSDDEGVDSIPLFFQQQLNVLNGLVSDPALKSLLQDYVEKGIRKDFQRVKTGSNSPPMLQELLANAASDLQTSLQGYLTRLKIIQDFFDVGSYSQGQVEKQESLDMGLSVEHKDLESVFKMLSECRSNMIKLEEKACKVLIEYSGKEESKIEKPPSSEYLLLSYDPKGTPGVISQKSNEEIEKIFEVTTGALKNKSYISLAVKNGKVSFQKNINDGQNTGTSYTSSQVIQLLKSKTSKTKLGIQVENAHMKNYNFESYRARELFCSTIQQMKIAHSTDPQSAQLSVFIGTWNMGNAGVEDVTEWFQCCGLGKTKLGAFSHISSDIYAIGTQETAYHEKEWTKILKDTLKKLFNIEFKLVTCYSMWDIRIVIFIKSELYNHLNSLKQSSVKTGIANTLGNKGAVGVSFNVDSTSFCFINCHLTSGNEKCIRRNQNFHSILRSLNLHQGNTFDLTLSFHHLFWFGDLNYRIDLDVVDIIKSIMESDWQKLLKADQLCHSIEDGNAFVQFQEEDLTFPPTYRYDRDHRNTYNWRKVKRTGVRINVPSWCDRVLWKSYPNMLCCNTTYGCTETICTSDHSPVFATFDVGIFSQKLKSHSEHCSDHSQGSMKPVKITVFSAEAKILTSSATKFVVEFYSDCLEKMVSSKKNSHEDFIKKQDSLFRSSSSTDKKAYTYPWWTKNDIQELNPVLSDPYYLEDQYLQIAVKGVDGQESYGECVISLKPLLDGTLYTVGNKLTHYGTETGLLELQIQMIIPGAVKYTPSVSSKVYDFIKVGEEGDSTSTTLSKVVETNPESKKELLHLIQFPTDKAIDRKSIAQVDPINKVVESPHMQPTHLNDRKLSLGYDNPIVKYTKAKGDMVPELPPKRKSLARGSLSDGSPGSPVSPTFDDGARSMIPKSSQSLPRFLRSESPPPVPKPRAKKKEKAVSKFQQWLHDIGYEQYHELLVNNGFDDLEYFCAVTEDDLRQSGITNNEHRKEIVKCAINLIRKSSKKTVPV